MLSSIAMKLIGSSGATGTSAQLPSCSTWPGCSNSARRETSCSSGRGIIQLPSLCTTIIKLLLVVVVVAVVVAERVAVAGAGKRRRGGTGTYLVVAEVSGVCLVLPQSAVYNALQVDTFLAGGLASDRASLHFSFKYTLARVICSKACPCSTVTSYLCAG